MKLTALKEIRYNTRRLLPGDEFEATPAHGRLLIAIKKAADPLKREVGRVAKPKASVLQKASAAVTRSVSPQPSGAEGAVLPATLGPAGDDKSMPPAEPVPEGSTTPAALHPPGETLETLRAEYQALVGKKPFNGWDVETLQMKIAAARAG
jgi:hypothetical protein